MEIQILDWKAKDVEVSTENSDDDGNSSDESNISKKYFIHGFGINSKGESVSVNINGYTPYFYVKPPHSFDDLQFRSFKRSIIELLGSKFEQDISSIIRLNKNDLWGFNNNTKFQFIRLSFKNHITMRICINKFLNTLREKNDEGEFTGKVTHKLNSIKVCGKMMKFQLYESNIEPFIRFLHCKDIKPSGWIRVKNTMKHGGYSERTTCKHNVIVKWKDIESIPDKETIAPLLVASFDIECTSSHGDFPLAKKGYEKFAKELMYAYQCEKEKTHNTFYLKSLIKDALYIVFELNDLVKNESYRSYFSKIYFKSKKNPEIHSLLVKLVESISDILAQSCTQKQIHLCEQKYQDTEDDVLSLFRKQFNTTGNNNVKEDNNSIKKDVIIAQLNAFLNKHLPPIEGDSIIQIGTTFHRYGDTECFFKHIITLNTCDSVSDAQVISCKTEKEVLLEWTKMITHMDPDIITGYNIFGFDMQYMYDRACELKCKTDFCKLGRIHNKSCELIHKTLSSSALGDNYMHYIDMEGRVMIDLMKIIQRDHNLDSYKLDNVASHFIQGNIKDNLGTSVIVDNISGIQEKSYIHVISNDDKLKVFIESVDKTNKELKLNMNVQDMNIKKWGLAKDDVSPNEIFKAQKGTSSDRARIAKYCIQDCALCNAIIIKLEIVANNIGMSNVCSVPLSYIFMRGQGVKIFSLVSQQARIENTLIPTMLKYDEDVEDDSGYEGAIVLNPIPGIYVNEPISVMDYASLYPSSMISENISHDSLVIDEKYDNLPGIEYVDIVYDIYEGVGDKKHKVGEKTSRFAQFPDGKKGILPRILNHLLKNRKDTRKRILMKKVILHNSEVLQGYVKYESDNIIITTSSNENYTFQKEEVKLVEDLYNDFMKAVLDGLQLAYKITANSLYGQVGAKTSPIYMKELAASTTATGRNLIMKAKEFMEQNYDAHIVYGDTDSIFVNFRLNEKEGLSGKEALTKSIELSCKASKEFKDAFLKKPHDLEYEKTFYPFVILSKKRYVGNLYEFDINKFKQKSMGIVLKRRDNANIVKYIYGGIIDIILNERDIQKATVFLKNALNDLMQGNIPLEELIITKTLRGEYKDPSKIAHRVLADRMGERDPGSKPQVNDRIPYVYIINKDKKALQGNKIEHPNYIREMNLKPDYAFYISNQIMKPVSQLLALDLENIPGYSRKNDPLFFKNKEKILIQDYKGNMKKVYDKITALRMDEVDKIIFNPILSVINAKTNGNKSILDYY